MNVANEPIPPLPYSGSRLKEHQAGKIVSRYGTDQSGLVEYRFNSLGFRGEEYDPDAEFRVLICGSSTAFTTGVPDEDTWWHMLKAPLAAQKGISPDAINVLNFAEGGCSYDYVSRVTLTQAERVRPDIIVISTGAIKCGELITDKIEEIADRGFNISRGLMKYARNPDPESLKVPDNPDIGLDAWREIFHKAVSYFGFNTGSTFLLDALKNLYIVQAYCESRNIPFVCWARKRDSLQTQLAQRNLSKPVSEFLELINVSRVLSLDIDNIDKANDGLHPGPRAQAFIASEVMKTLKSLYG